MRNSLKNTHPMYIVFMRFYFGKKAPRRKPPEIFISDFAQNAGENTMEKRLKVFYAHSSILL